MDVSEFLRNRDIEFSTIVTATQAAVGLEPDDVLLAVGSLAEGLGNTKSDLDLLLVIARNSGAQNVPLVLGKCLFDIEVMPVMTLEDIVRRFTSWLAQPWNPAQGSGIRPEERQLLHRLLHSWVLFAGLNDRVAALTPSKPDLARLKLHVARHLARATQVDMAGYFHARDYPSLVFASQDLLGHAADGLAAGHRLTNPTAKWRSRMLNALPTTWEESLRHRPTGLSALQLFWSLHRAPQYPQAVEAVRHALRIATFARAAFAWAERQLVAGSLESSRTFRWACVRGAADETPLPQLGVDIDFSQQNGELRIARLNEFAESLQLSATEFDVTLLFDGITTAREAQRALSGSASDQLEPGLVKRVADRVTAAGFIHLN
jgi:hypothetical protein